jgi:hypothetical protein
MKAEQVYSQQRRELVEQSTGILQTQSVTLRDVSVLCLLSGRCTVVAQRLKVNRGRPEWISFKEPALVVGIGS